MIYFPRAASNRVRSNRAVSGERAAILASTRVVFASAAGLVLAFAAIYRLAVPDDFDPIWLRVVIAALSFAALIASYYSRFVQERCVTIASLLLYLLTAWFLGLAYLNDFDAEYSLGLVFTIAAAGYALIATRRGIASVFGYAVASTVAVGFFIALAPTRETNAILIVGIVCGIGVVIVLAARLRQQLLESLSSSEQRFKKLSEAAFEAIFVTDDERIVDCNLNALLILGRRSRYQVLGCSLTDFMPREDARRTRGIIEGGHPYRFEARMVQADGTIIPVEIRGRAAEQEGHTVRVIVARDISEQKRHEAELIGARKQVESALETRNAILNNVSHEFRTPLAIMLGYAEMLKEGKFDEASELGELIYESGRKLNDTLNLILELAQIQGGGFALYKERLDVAELVQEVVGTHLSRAEAKGLQLTVRGETGKHIAVTDRIRLLKVVDYLVDNAIKFTHEGSVGLSVRSDTEPVSIAVSDTGIGIDKEFLPQVFHPFTQQSSGLTRSHGGLGVGLSIAYHMAEIMGGTIEVESIRGEGSTFTIRLPHGIERKETGPSRSYQDASGNVDGEPALWM